MPAYETSSDPMKVLLIDDCEDDRELVVRSLKDLDCEIVQAGSLEEAFPLIDDADCVIVDLRMPDCSSFGTIEHFLFGLKIPVLAISGVEPEGVEQLSIPFFTKYEIETGVVGWVREVKDALRESNIVLD